MSFSKTVSWTVALVFAVGTTSLFMGGSSGCGGGGGGASGTPSGPESSESLEQEGAALLENGDVAGAQSKYDESLAVDPDNTQAAFGAALARLLLLPESAPSQKILGELGQGEFKVSNVVGPTGYLAALNAINEAEVTMDTYSGPFHGWVVSQSNSWPSSLTSVNCSTESVRLDYRNEDNSLWLQAYVYVFAQAEKDGTILSSFQWNEGDSVQLSQTIDMSDCASGWSVINLIARVNEDYYVDGDGSSGSITLVKAGRSLGDDFELAFSNVVLTSWDGKKITLNGTVKDVLTKEAPDTADYFPFAETAEGIQRKNKINVILAKARDGLTSAELVAEAMDFVPLFQEIKELLAQADRENDFRFVIPKGLYFGNKDVPINRIDLKGIRAGIGMTLAGFYLADSWNFEIEVGSLYDEAGNALYSKEEVVDQLNRFFELKSDNHLDEAQTEIAEGLQLVLDAHDLISEVTTDGIIEEAPGTAAGYAEFRDAVSIIQKSLSERQLFPYVNPVVNISLNSFFNDPPDASEIDFDPFVIENGDIKPVEAFFEKLLEGTIDLDLTKTYRKAFTALEDSNLGKAVFDEFDNFFAAGRFLNILKND